MGAYANPKRKRLRQAFEARGGEEPFAEATSSQEGAKPSASPPAPAGSAEPSPASVVAIRRPVPGRLTSRGAARTFSLPATKAQVRFCTMRVYAPGGTVIEGQGVEPDVPIRPRRAQLLAGEDATLEAARSDLRR